MNDRDRAYMSSAIEAAKKACVCGEVPVGAVVVYKDEIIAEGFNTRETVKNGLNHAELIAISSACEKLGSWRLCDCELYVTLEPCPMCAGAIINARVKRVVFGAYDQKGGACGSVINLFAMGFNHRPQCSGGVLEGECSALLKEFFRNLRK